MHHAEAHERLSDLALEPGRLAGLDSDRGSSTAELRAHIAGCETCAADVAGWLRTWEEAGAALAGRPVLAEIRAPASLRATTLAAVAAEARTSPRGRGMDNGAGTRTTPRRSLLATVARSRRAGWLVAAAAMVVATLGASFGVARQAEVAHLQAEAAELEAVAATFDRVLAAPVHWAVTLRTADGTAAGTLAWSDADVVMVASGLPAPRDGQAYRCWVEQAGARTPMGSLAFASTTGYWAGPTAAWGGGWTPGTRFGVSLVPQGGQPTPVLVGTY